MNLPPLPTPVYHVWGWDHEVDATTPDAPMFTTDQMRAYGEACARAAAEEMRERSAEIAAAHGADEPYGHAKFRCVSIGQDIRALPLPGEEK